MVVGIGKIIYRLHGCRSLKEKRGIVKSIIHKIQVSFNVSAAETGANDLHQKAEIGFAMVGNSTALINSKMDLLLNMADDIGLAELVDSEMEIIQL